MTFISARPTSAPGNNLKKCVSQFSSMRYFQRGRDALLFGLNFKARRKGSILFPAFFCVNSTTPLVKAGFDVDWIDVCEDLSFDLDRLSERLDTGNIVAVVVCDFFGWYSTQIQKIVELSRERKVLVIRDCSHSALSWKSEQSQADLTIFSFRKTFPVWDGGALIGCGNSIIGARNFSWWARNFQREFTRMSEQFFCRLGIINPYKVLDFLRREKWNVSVEDIKIYGETSPSKSLMRWLENDSALHNVANIRRKNFLFIQEAFDDFGMSSFFPILGMYDVPQVFPLKVSNAPSLVSFLRSRGVGATQWPGGELAPMVLANRGDFPVTCKLNDTIACLPIHQDLELSDFKKMVVLVNEWSKVSR